MKEGDTITFKGIKLTAVLSSGCESADGCGFPTGIACHLIKYPSTVCAPHCIEEFVFLDTESLAKHLAHKLIGEGQ